MLEEDQKANKRRSKAMPALLTKQRVVESLQGMTRSLKVAIKAKLSRLSSKVNKRVALYARNCVVLLFFAALCLLSKEISSIVFSNPYIA